MKAEDILLGGILVGAVAGLVYWCFKSVNKPPEEPTPEMIQQAFYEYLDRMEFERQWLAEDGY